MYFQKAERVDFQSILDLQNKNLIHNLTDSEKLKGFLSVEFTAEQFETMNQESGIVVCKTNEIVYGYLCTSSIEFNRPFALPAAMIGLYPQLNYKGKSLNQYRSVIVGPWCISQDSRGKGIFSGMWNALNKILANNIELLTTFISTSNSRSLGAARKVGMEEITVFKFKGNEFHILAKNNG